MHARMHKTVKLVESYSTVSSHNGVLNSLKLSFSGIEFIESWDPIFAKENPEEDELLGIVSGPRVLSGSPPPILLRVVLLAELIILSRGVEPISPNGGKRLLSITSTLQEKWVWLMSVFQNSSNQFDLLE